jgi:hypothetical protein
MDTVMIIESTVSEFVKAKKLFTSVDIANAIKSNGTWVRNNVVADWLRKEFTNFMSNQVSDYTTTVITVNYGSDRAALYHPLYESPMNYMNSNLEAIDPFKFKDISGYAMDDDRAKPENVKSSSFFKCTSVSASENTVMNTNVVKKVGVNIPHKVYKSVDRLRVPASLVKAVGMAPYSKVKTTKISIVVPDTLRVHSDGRISLPRNCTKLGSGPIKVGVVDGVIDIQKM